MDLKQFFMLFITVEKSFAISILKVDEKLCNRWVSPECTNQPVCCHYLQLLPRLIRSSIASIFSLKTETCRCQEKCFRSQSMMCVHGKCNEQRTKCLCEHCWSGRRCDQFVNKNPPSFESSDTEVSISSDHPLKKTIHQIEATDADQTFCNSKENCRCANILYQLKRTSEIFRINEQTGKVYLVRRPEMKTYSLDIVAKNYGDNTKEAYTKLKIKVRETDMTSPNDTIPHHRYRRSTSNPLIISATPYLKDTYYFGKGETIVFKVTVSYNGSSGVGENIRIRISSEWLDLSSPVKNELDGASMVGDEAEFTLSLLQPNEVKHGNVSGTVKDSVLPLSSLYLELTVDSDFSSVVLAKSTPTVYSVFPEVNVTRTKDKAISVYETVPVQMLIELPFLNYTFDVELTTNIEDYVFMEIRNVTVNTGNVFYNGSGIAKSHTSPGNAEIDRVTVDFGYLQVSNPIHRFIDISFNVFVSDHPLVANGSFHWFGVGLQAGPKILWVQQQELLIIKIEPALELNVSSSFITNFTKFYIRNRVNVSFDIAHAPTSLERAYNVSLTFVTSKNLLPVTGTYAELNDTAFRRTYTHLDTLDTVSEVIEFEIKADISPLLTLPIVATLEYINQGGIQKRPVNVVYDGIVTGTPTISFNLNGSNVMTPGDKRTFHLTILLLKMKSPLKAEIIMPKANGFPILTILSFKVHHIGKNINGLNPNATPIYRNSTSNAYMIDQATIDLGIGINEHGETDEEDNQVTLSVSTVMNENSNITNSSNYWVGAGIVAEPNMVWIGQVDINTYISPNRKPYLNISLDGRLNGTTYCLDVSIQHSPTSDMFAHNISFEYLLAPFMKFLSVEESSDHIQKDSSKPLFQYSPVLYFTKQIKHSIKIKLDPSKSSSTGSVTFAIPVRIEYSDVLEQQYNYMTSISDVMKVISRNPTIPKSNEAKKEYYGRGYYLKDDNAYICMNQHVPTSTPACYISQDGYHWSALDLRVGCILGHAGSNELYAIARNQITVLKYKDDEEDWEYILDRFLPNFAWQFKNIESADFTDLPLKPDEKYFQKYGSKEWIGSGEGLFQRDVGNVTWVMAAAWRFDE